ncbi:hypothetical protein L1987_71578 [Smallanthus sonchifolius]|uniref:Uncharacterized protein n=1 Tax=Smallanthus sonchifolius TaxID=185202 RepID=A0ACB9AT51_9ASTR|nr:hypothetical protein L1987_71578 [Smallanthus sonchifolius]
MVMENYLNQNFHAVKSKHSSDEVLRKWRSLCHVVKNPKRRFRFTANLSKRNEAAAMRRTNQLLGVVWEALHDMTLMILAMCAFVSLVVGIATERWPKGAHDGLGIVTSILLVVFVTATSDYRQSLQFRDLDKEKKQISIQVTRNGYKQKLSIYVLPGDIVHLAIGDQVPTDGLFLSGFSVSIDESSLTGESEPAMVSAENPWLMSGTKVQDGSCKMLVTIVGMRTQWGKLMATLSEGGDDETPLQVKLNGVATVIGKIGLFFSVVTFAVLVQKLLTRKIIEQSQWNILELLEYFAIAVTIVVVAVPEGLPLAVTLSLAFAMKKMMNDKALVCHVAACETMGSATSICSDKTGTLTTNRMTVVKSCICLNIKDVNKQSKPDIPDKALKILLQSIFTNTGGEVVNNKEGKREILGTPKEAVILEFGLSLGGDFQTIRQASTVLRVEPFNSSKKRMGVVLKLPEGGVRAHGKDLDESVTAETLIPSSWYTCIGIVGIKDPVRPGVKESVALCRSAEKILRDDGIAIEGPVFHEKSLEELDEIIPKIQVMSRSSPLDKHTLVKHLRTTFGEVVAVTGDGTNDAPALHEADIGLAMGIAGTELFNEINSREMAKVNVLNRIWKNNVFVSVLSATVVFQVIIIEFLGTFASTSPLPMRQWYYSVLTGFLSMPIAVVLKMIPVCVLTFLFRSRGLFLNKYDLIISFRLT